MQSELEKKLAEVEKILVDGLILGHSPYQPGSTVTGQFRAGYDKGREDHKSWAMDVTHAALKILRSI